MKIIKAPSASFVQRLRVLRGLFSPSPSSSSFLLLRITFYAPFMHHFKTSSLIVILCYVFLFNFLVGQDTLVKGRFKLPLNWFFLFLSHKNINAILWSIIYLQRNVNLLNWERDSVRRNLAQLLLGHHVATFFYCCLTWPHQSDLYSCRPSFTRDLHKIVIVDVVYWTSTENSIRINLKISSFCVCVSLPTCCFSSLN